MNSDLQRHLSSCPAQVLPSHPSHFPPPPLPCRLPFPSIPSPLSSCLLLLPLSPNPSPFPLSPYNLSLPLLPPFFIPTPSPPSPAIHYFAHVPFSSLAVSPPPSPPPLSLDRRTTNKCRTVILHNVLSRRRFVMLSVSRLFFPVVGLFVFVCMRVCLISFLVSGLLLFPLVLETFLPFYIFFLCYYEFFSLKLPALVFLITFSSPDFCISFL